MPTAIKKMTTKYRDGTFVRADKVRIYYQYWLPSSEPRALMLLVHGAGEHSGRYGYFVKHFTALGYVVAALDHPGHGRSEGRRGYIPRFGDYLDTLETFHRQISTEFTGLRQILVGHSMGGLISSHYLLKHQDDFVGCVLSGPALLLHPDLKPGVLMMAIVRLLSAVLPRLPVLGIDATSVSRDPEEVRKFRNDPLVFKGKASARSLAELIGAMDRFQDEAARIHLPLLLLHGGADLLASPEASRFLNARAVSGNKTLRIYPDLYHEIFNEPEREQVFADIEIWCDALLKQHDASSITEKTS